MHIVIVHDVKIPALKYGGTERVIWYLGKELVKKGHKVTYIVPFGSYSDFANIILMDETKNVNSLIPEDADVVHFNFVPEAEIYKPYIITIHGNHPKNMVLDRNSVFVSQNHANRYNSKSFVYNGLDWDDYSCFDFRNRRDYFHFLGNAAWRVKNIRGAIATTLRLKKEYLYVLGGNRLNIKMGLRLTLSPRVKFFGMVGGDEKNKLLSKSKGLVFPVMWHEPFGLAIIESLYFGSAVFGTPYGSLPEIITEEFGFLSDKASELSEKMLDVSSYSQDKCRQYAIDKFNSQLMAEKYIKLYHKVLSGEMLNDTNPQLINESPKFLSWSNE